MHHKWRPYDVWFLRYQARRTEFFVILGHFLPCDPPNNQKKIKILKIWEKTPGNIILHFSSTNDDRMMCGSWYVERDRRNFFSFRAIFCPFTPVTTWKIKILKKKNKQKKKKKKKNAWRYHYFTYVYQKLGSDDVRFLKYGARGREGGTEGRTGGKSDIWRWVPHLKNQSKFSKKERSQYPTNIYFFKVNNRNTRKRCEICSKLIIKTPERCWSLLLIKLQDMFKVNNKNSRLMC